MGVVPLQCPEAVHERVTGPNISSPCLHEKMITAPKPIPSGAEMFRFSETTGRDSQLIPMRKYNL